MMQVLAILLFTFLQFCAGFGILCLLKIYLKPAFCISLSVLIGVAFFSLVPFLLQLAFIPLTVTNIFLTLNGACFLLNVNSRKGFVHLKQQIKQSRPALKLYEIPSLLLIAFFVFASAWRCYYYPPSPRDLTSGPEVIAEYAVKEKSMINSVFSVDLQTTNNQFKPPFITSLQIIYKYAGFPFGQVWLTTIVIFFLVFLYHALSIRLHRSIAGWILVAFAVIPEMYAYTFMALFDYSNAVFFCLSLYFLFSFFKNRQRNFLLLSGLLMAIATYTRSETLLLAGLVAITLFIHQKRNRSSWKNLLKNAMYFLLPSALIYFISISVYINLYLPSDYEVNELMNKNLLHLQPLVKRFVDMNEQVIFGTNGVNYYGYFIFIFTAVMLLDAMWKEEWDTTSLNWLYGVLVIYLGLPIISYLLPLFDLDHSTKRGLFKIFPLMLLYMANSKLLIAASERIKKWEERVKGERQEVKR